ncbi:hypothetical protein [Bacillus sp. CDB3]|uniref:hypothetical protein n=1 Tax=Bacillus sp. CDB3 TaxID=360310 RepID=UPI0009D83C3B|nr:hypothetical protein [Bacillus sp. CDB3]OQR53435.1 hypothetical protein CDB3_29810 [Bacillus sp. CDB3]
MIRFFKALFGGISVSLAYIIVTMCSPLILMLMGYTNINSSPKLFGTPLYTIRTSPETFFSEGTPLGLILSLIIGILLYYLVTKLAKLARKSPPSMSKK